VKVPNCSREGPYVRMCSTHHHREATQRCDCSVEGKCRPIKGVLRFGVVYMGQPGE